MGHRSLPRYVPTSEHAEELAIILAGLSGYVNARYPEDAALKQIHDALEISKRIMRRTRNDSPGPISRGGYIS